MATNPAPVVSRLKSYVERIERLEEEKAGLLADIRNVYSEAKGDGYDPKIMRQIVRLRRLDNSDRQELESLIEAYKAEIGMA